MLLPNVIIAGAPKCGTTSVFEFLSDHPEVCASSVKETCYLMDQDYPLYNPERNVAEHGLVGYREYFSHCEGKTPRVLLEATPDYLYQKTPLEYIPRFESAPEIILVLRRPEDRVYSMFQFARNNMATIDPATTFAEYLRETDNPHSGLLIERPLLRDTIDQSRYAKYIESWLSVLGRERIHVFLFEELAEDPLAFMRSVCAAIGVDPGYYESYSFSRKNATRKVRYQGLHRLKRNLRRLGVNLPGRSLIGNLYRSLNAKPVCSGRSVEDQCLVEQLGHRFTGDNQDLSELLSIDLTRWS